MPVTLRPSVEWKKWIACSRHIHKEENDDLNRAVQTGSKSVPIPPDIPEVSFDAVIQLLRRVEPEGSQML